MERRQLSITGQVQGVGFRPFVHQLAARLGVAGSIRNDGDGVGIDCRAAAEVLDRFERAIAEQAPPLARIEAFASRRIPLDPAAPDP
ncbi:MAG: acylphosphatase, partial [Chloroflexi bacterium]|nr:acylphosphatase [Chloroflexota bacterium]